jgi:hypothetical protein
MPGLYDRYLAEKRGHCAAGHTMRKDALDAQRILPFPRENLDERGWRAT